MSAQTMVSEFSQISKFLKISKIQNLQTILRRQDAGDYLRDGERAVHDSADAHAVHRVPSREGAAQWNGTCRKVTIFSLFCLILYILPNSGIYSVFCSVYLKFARSRIVSDV